MSKFFSSVRLEKNDFGHDRLGFWQNGNKSGELVLTEGTGQELLALLRPMVKEMYIKKDDGSFIYMGTEKLS